ncbi:MAG: ankyrin repeat-containing domain protein [Linnemannia gamsii]|nr:MAG: ankyrin repeat-containing domain protein [Linnemannia gamsii]
MSDDGGASNNERLAAACKEDNLDLLEEVLEADASTFDVNHTDALGNAALHYAARHGSTGCLEILLYYDGIDVNVINRLEGETPLHKAAAYSDPEIALDMAQILVNGGASTKLKNKLKQTPADKAPSDTHAEVKEFLENVALASMVDLRDIPAEDSDSDGVASDDD